MPFNYGRWKKEYLKKLCFSFMFIIRVEYNELLARNQTEKIFRIFIFQDLIKKAKFSTPTSILKGLQSQFLIDFFFWCDLIARVKASQALYWVDSRFFSKRVINPLSANPTKWSDTLKQFVGNLPTNCVSVFDHFVKLELKGLTVISVALGNTFWNMRERPVVLLNFS